MENIKLDDFRGKKAVMEHKGNLVKPVFVNGVFCGYVPFPTTVTSVKVELSVKSTIEGVDPTSTFVTARGAVVHHMIPEKNCIYNLFLYSGWNEEVDMNAVTGVKVSPIVEGQDEQSTQEN